MWDFNYDEIECIVFALSTASETYRIKAKLEDGETAKYLMSKSKKAKELYDKLMNEIYRQAYAEAE